MQSWRQSPGCGNAMWRTWNSTSMLDGLDPVRPVERQRQRHEPAAELRELRDAGREKAQHVLEAHTAARRRRRVVDRERRDVHEVVPALELQEHRVGAGELLHRRTPGVGRGGLWRSVCGPVSLLPSRQAVHPVPRDPPILAPLLSRELDDAQTACLLLASLGLILSPATADRSTAADTAGEEARDGRPARDTAATTTRESRSRKAKVWITRHTIKMNGARWPTRPRPARCRSRTTTTSRSRCSASRLTSRTARAPGTRPIMFAYNGGPGSASGWLHMGILGPKRTVLKDLASNTVGPFRTVDNDFSILDRADLVMIDPVGTGLLAPDRQRRRQGILGRRRGHQVGLGFHRALPEPERPLGLAQVRARRKLRRHAHGRRGLRAAHETSRRAERRDPGLALPRLQSRATPASA